MYAERRVKDIEDEVNDCFKNEDALVIVALMFLSSSKKGLIPELMSFLKLDDLKKFIYIHGGETITIPSVKEFQFSLTCAISVYYKVVKNKTWTSIQDTLDVDDPTFAKVKRACDNWIKSAKESDIKFLKSINDLGDQYL